MTGGIVIGDQGPVLMLSAADCRLLLGELVLHARGLQERGQADRVDALRPLLRNLTFLRGQADLRRASFRMETTTVNSDPLDGTSNQEWFSTAQAAEVTGMTRQWIAELAKRGAIEARRVGRGWAVSPSAVEQLRTGAA